MSFRSWIRNWLHSDDGIKVARDSMAVSSSSEFDTPIRLSITPARGGIVVTTRNYDRQKDRNNEIVHVIHDDEDVARRIGEIVAMELMKA
jgi:hypothetical protein